MSNNQVKQGFGNVQDVDRSGIHPSLSRQREEIAVLKRNITPEEVEIAINAYVQAKYDRLKHVDHWDENKNSKIIITKLA